MSSPMYEMPVHFPIGVNAAGQGPVMPDDPEYSHDVCWCGVSSCVAYLTPDTDRHGEWDKDNQRYEDGCKEDRPHA